MTKEAKIIAFVAVKGGVGKTTLAYNVASYLASKGKKVLAIDLDFQANMTSNFCLSDEELEKSNISSVFASELEDVPTDIKPVQIDKEGNLFGLTSDDGLEDIDGLFSNINNGWSVVTRYLINKVHANENFDYIIFDTHPNLALATQNAVINSDIMIVPFGPNRFSVQSLDAMADHYKTLQKRFTTIDGTPYLNAKMLYIGNMVDFNTRQSHKFVEIMKDNPDCIGYFHRRQAFVKAEVSRSSVLSFLSDEKSTAKSEHKSTKAIDKAADEIETTLNEIYKTLENN
ncbi:ParA family protein [Apilactobacillus timberlakei]|uniref:ParA family protein n=1 Tax=Apilactobacillus timberlakei TaxID=2008380 RepID=UPI001125CE78|nr:ParA family protein [Apilactobacillus timberlakei]TPR14965.1 ParA family protein [Apilactobacillus timberlakei]